MNGHKLNKKVLLSKFKTSVMISPLPGSQGLKPYFAIGDQLNDVATRNLHIIIVRRQEL